MRRSIPYQIVPMSLSQGVYLPSDANVTLLQLYQYPFADILIDESLRVPVNLLYQRNVAYI